jgi:hypothetical protein
VAPTSGVISLVFRGLGSGSRCGLAGQRWLRVRGFAGSRQHANRAAADAGNVEIRISLANLPGRVGLDLGRRTAVGRALSSRSTTWHHMASRAVASDRKVSERLLCRHLMLGGLADAPADTSTPHGKLILTVLGGLAEFERSLILARTRKTLGPRLAASVMNDHPS